MKNPYLLADEEDPKLLPGLTPGTSDQAAPPVAPAPAPIAPPMVAPTPAPVAPPAGPPPMKLPGMPQSVGMSDIEPYLNKQRNSLSRFGPDQQMELQNNLNARRDSLGYKSTEGLKGFADALMMGVARAGNPNWQGQFQNQENQFAQDQMSTFKDARAANVQQVESGMSLDKMDPNSELSKSSQQAYAPLFEKLGYDPSALGGMSAAKIDSTLALMTQFGGMEIQSMIKQYELEIERAKMAQVAGKTASEQELAKKKMKTDAASEILKRSGNAKFLGVPIPFTSDVSGKEENDAKQVLLDQMNDSTTSYIKTATNPKTGERIGTKDGKNWEPIE